MSNQKSPGADLEPIEKASRDELQALQLQRMKWSLQHAYDNVPHYRKKYDAAGVHPSDLKQLSDLARVPLHHQARPARHLPLRHDRDADARRGAGSRLVRHHRQADSGRLHEERHRDVGPLMARSLRAAGVTADDIILNSYGYGLFTGGLGAHYGGEAWVPR
jgi:phenylacetate-CoA ligase